MGQRPRRSFPTPLAEPVFGCGMGRFAVTVMWRLTRNVQEEGLDWDEVPAEPELESPNFISAETLKAQTEHS